MFRNFTSTLFAVAFIFAAASAQAGGPSMMHKGGSFVHKSGHGSGSSFQKKFVPSNSFHHGFNGSHHFHGGHHHHQFHHQFHHHGHFHVTPSVVVHPNQYVWKWTPAGLVKVKKF